jgi:hypothetical protein
MIRGGTGWHRATTGRVSIAVVATLVVVALVVGVAVVWWLRSSADGRLHGTWRRLDARAAQFTPPAEFRLVRATRSGTPCLSVSGCASPTVARDYSTTLPAADACTRLAVSVRALPGVSHVRDRGEDRDASGAPDRSCAIEATIPEGGLGAGVFPQRPAPHDADLVVRVSFIGRA